MDNTVEFEPIILSFLITFLLTCYLMPKVITKMEQAKICGVDVNKIDKPAIPEMGGIGSVLGFSLGSSISIAVFKYVDQMSATPLLVSISVLCIAALIGLMDDVSILGRKEKAWFISFASLPLVISQLGDSEIDAILFEIKFSSQISTLFFWIVLVPFGITGCANALNMSAGYNGLESGQIVIISFSLLLVSIINGIDKSLLLIIGGIIGSVLSLFMFNRFPARIFVGDVGTLGFGALIASVVIMSNQIIFGIICIAPSFYELYSTVKYKIKGVERRDACMNPQIDNEGILTPPKGSENYTLAYLALSLGPCNENRLVLRILSLYLVSGFLAVLIAYYL